MRKMIFIYGIIIFILYCSFSMSYAIMQETVYLDSNKDVLQKGEEVEISAFTENNNVAALNLNLYYDNEKLEYISGPENTNVIDNRIIHVWYDENGGNTPKNGELAKFTFKAKKDGIANFTVDGEFYNNTPVLIQMDFKETSVKIGKEEMVDSEASNKEDLETIKIEDNKNTNLENLAIQDILLNPTFDRNIKKYNIEISENIEKLNILAIPENENASINIIGNENLKTGDNLIKVEVTAQDKISKNIYEINAHKRNAEEEQIYEKGQEENAKKLQQIYNVQKTSSEAEVPKNSNVESVSEKSNFTHIIIVSMVASLAIGVVVFKYKKVHL